MRNFPRGLLHFPPGVAQHENLSKHVIRLDVNRSLFENDYFFGCWEMFSSLRHISMQSPRFLSTQYLWMTTLSEIRRETSKSAFGAVHTSSFHEWRSLARLRGPNEVKALFWNLESASLVRLLYVVAYDSRHCYLNRGVAAFDSIFQLLFISKAKARNEEVTRKPPLRDVRFPSSHWFPLPNVSASNVFITLRRFAVR